MTTPLSSTSLPPSSSSLLDMSTPTLSTQRHRTTTYAAAALTAIVTFGTIYGAVYDTALDTSSPLSYLSNPSSTHPHHAHTRIDGHTGYLAQKHNIFNTYFVKKAWGWTTAAFLGMFLSSPPTLLNPTRRLARYAMSTVVWSLFTAWFFGPGVFDRLNVLSGAECLVRLPDDVSIPTSAEGVSTDGKYVHVPADYCHQRTVLTSSSLPELQSALAGAASVAGNTVLETYKLRPKLYRGHDISGHLFLLTLSTLFLVNQLTPSVKLLFPSLFPSPSRPPTSKAELPTTLHVYSVYFGLALTALWMFMALTTSVYFHTVGEKVTGFGEWLFHPLTSCT